jgi:thioredoxin reductase (NADPH)
MNTVYDVIIMGSGPAGLTAGIYTSRANLKTLCIAGATWGGQLMQTTLVENFPGFPEGIQGPELMTNMRKQAEKLNVEFLDDNVSEVDFSQRPFGVKVASQEYKAQSVIIATGAEFKWLGLPNEQKLIGRGVSACATCDAAFFKNKKVVVVGGGDSAMEEALYLSKFASEVIIVHRKAEFRASKAMQDRVFAEPKIKVMWNVEVKDVVGENKVEGVMLSDGQTLSADGMFVAIGHTPATKLFENKIDLDAAAYAARKGQKYHTMSNVEGVFIAGDVHDHTYRQAITAAGYGCESALDAERWLTEQK